MQKPLADLKVLDLTRILAGPYATQILGDLGADVIKVEPKNGDETRRWGPPFIDENANYYFTANRNKRNLCVDFNHPNDLNHIKKLASQADIVIENFRFGSLKKFCLDYDSLKENNHQLIYCSITGYGHKSEKRSEPGFDAMIQAESGLMSLTGDGDFICKVGIPTADLSTGLYAVIAILAAVNERKSSGLGQHIDLSLFNVQASLLSTMAMNFLFTREDPRPRKSSHPSIVPYQSFACKDQEIFIAVGSDPQFVKFCIALEKRWHEEQKYKANENRVTHREQLIQEIEAVLSTKNCETWLKKLHQAGVPAARVNKLSDLKDHENNQAYQLFDVFNNSEIPLVRSPLQFSRTPINEYKKPETSLNKKYIEFE